MKSRTCVNPKGKFIYGIHKPSYRVVNLREQDRIESLGIFSEKLMHDNRANFPVGDVVVEQADWIFEIPNAFPFKGATYIGKSWADKKAKDPGAIVLPSLPETSLSAVLRKNFTKDGEPAEKLDQIFEALPQTILLTLATTSTDAEELERLAKLSCEFVFAADKERPTGLKYRIDEKGEIRPVIRNHPLFEALVNNYYLSDDFKEIMVLKPGTQGKSEIVGGWPPISESSRRQGHVFEYLRANSYIPWGHYAANMANDSIRYRIADLTAEDMTGLRHLYYERTYVRLAEELGVPVLARWKCLAKAEIEELRKKVIAALVAAEAGFSSQKSSPMFTGTLWGWNYGFDFAASGYRLHASHQQVHQQFAMIPASVSEGNHDQTESSDKIFPFACGDMVTEFIQEYRKSRDSDFFKDYLRAIRTNERMDERKNLPDSLIVYEDENIMLFVPKAQTSQWELQIMTLQPVGNILEADLNTRNSLDYTLLIAMRILTRMGARMITTIEYAKRFAGASDAVDIDQRLLYVFLPILPESPGGFSEAQFRWIMGHYPEDFAAACRAQLEQYEQNI